MEGNSRSRNHQPLRVETVIDRRYQYRQLLLVDCESEVREVLFAVQVDLYFVLPDGRKIDLWHQYEQEPK